MTDFPYIFPVHWRGDVAGAFASFADKPGAFFLDATASIKNARNKRYSFFGWSPLRTFSSTGGFITIDGHTTIDDPVQSLNRFAAPLQHLPTDPYLPFYCGLVGYAGHEWGATDNRRPSSKTDLPDAWFGLYDTVVIFDHMENLLQVASMGLDETLSPNMTLAEERAHAMATQLIRVNEYGQQGPAVVASNVRPLPPASDVGTYQTIAKALHHALQTSPCHQVNLAQRFHAVVQQRPWEVHAKLRTAQCVPYATYIYTGDSYVSTTSPTRFLQCEGDQIHLQPAVGTISLSADEAELDAWQMAMQDASHRTPIAEGCSRQLSSVADHIICDEFQFSEDARSRYASLSIVATRKPGTSIVDTLSAMLPTPLMAGQPGPAALQLVNQNEPVRRNLYGGAIGYMASQGDAQFSLGLRLMTIKDALATVHAANWITRDSDPTQVLNQTTSQVTDFFKQMGIFTHRYGA